MAVLPQRWEWSKRPIQELPGEVTKYLAETELEALGGQVHEAVMIEPIATSTIGVIICLWLIFSIPADLTWLAHVLYVVILGFIVRLLYLAFEWRFNLIFITNKRIIYVHGLITRRVEMMPLSKLTDMSYIRTPLGTVLGYGTFRVESAGQDQALSRLSPIPDPDNSYRYVQNLLFGRATTDVRLVDITTERKVNVRWSGRTRGTSSGDFVVEQDDEPDDKFW